jgi:hypothetical protein
VEGESGKRFLAECRVWAKRGIGMSRWSHTMKDSNHAEEDISHVETN